MSFAKTGKLSKVKRKPKTTVSSSSVWKIRFCFREHIPFPIVPPAPRAAAAGAVVSWCPRLRRAAQERPPREVAGLGMSRRGETQKRGQRGRGGRSAPAGGWAPGHRRRPGSSHQTSATSDLREWLGPRGVPSHTSEPDALAARPRSPPARLSLLPTFWPRSPHGLSPPLAPSRAAGLCYPW
nr:uncharacterized protein LOC110539509 [Meriones unguiculatus]